MLQQYINQAQQLGIEVTDCDGTVTFRNRRARTTLWVRGNQARLDVDNEQCSFYGYHDYSGLRGLQEAFDMLFSMPLWQY